MLWKLSKTDQLREIPETTVFVRIDAHVLSGECKGGGGWGGGQSDDTQLLEMSISYSVYNNPAVHRKCTCH